MPVTSRTRVAANKADVPGTSWRLQKQLRGRLHDIQAAVVARAAGKVRASPLVKNLNSRLRSDSFRRRTLPCCYPKNSDSEPGPKMDAQTNVREPTPPNPNPPGSARVSDPAANRFDPDPRLAHVVRQRRIRFRAGHVARSFEVRQATNSPCTAHSSASKLTMFAPASSVCRSKQKSHCACVPSSALRPRSSVLRMPSSAFGPPSSVLIASLRPNEVPVSPPTV